MQKIIHNLTFVTEVDETHPTGIRLLSLEKEMQVTFLEGMLIKLVAPLIHEGGSWAILKVAE